MPAFSMIIESGRLVPATPCDFERLDSFRRGTKVRVRFTEERDRVLVKKWWAILGLVVKQCQTPWKTKEEASEAVKLALGIVNLTKTVKGDFLAYPKSLTDLEDPELQDAVEQMTELLSRITGVDVETLKKETAHIQPGPEHPHDPETGEITEPEASASPPQGDADVLENVVAATSPADPAGEPSSSSAGSDTPDMFGKFNFADGELQHLIDYARKALDDAASDGLAEARETKIETMTLNYRDVLESAEANMAVASMQIPIAAVVKRKRTREQAADFIARDVIGCKPEDLEVRK